MRKVEVLGLACLILAAQLALLLPALRVEGFIPEPYELYGVARDEYGGVLPNGSPIRTMIDGVDYSNKSSVFSRPGYNDGWFDVDTFGNYIAIPMDPGTPEVKEGGNESEPIMYAWGDMSNNTELNSSMPWLTGIVFKEWHEWHTNLPPQSGDLTAAPMSLQPPLIKIQSIVTNTTVQSPPNDYVTLCNPTPVSIDAGKFYIQKDVKGNMTGPSVQVSPGTIPPYGRYFVNLGTPDFFVETGDNVKLVWDPNSPGPDSPFGGMPIVVDRVEFNATTGGTLYWEPGNTIQNNEMAPTRGFQINRTASCGDTNSYHGDFMPSPEDGVVNHPPLAPWPLKIDVLTSDVNDNDTSTKHFMKTGVSIFPLGWTHNDPDGDSQIWADVQINDGPGRSGTAIWGNIIVGTAQTTTFPGGLLPCMHYYYSVRTRDQALWGPFAEWHFNTNCLPVGLSNLDPQNFANLPPGPQTVSWTPATDGDPTDIINYTWMVDTDPAFPNPITGTTTGNTSSTFTTMGGTIYYWCVNASDGWQSIPCTPTWRFNTATPGPPDVTLLRPVGGEYWAGGSSQQINWIAVDDNTAPSELIFYLNYTSGASSGAIAGPVIGTTSYPWTLPTIDATDVKVNITAIDRDRMRSWRESGAFTIDSTPPSISNYTPSGWNLPLDSQVEVVFSESVNAMAGKMTESFGLLDNTSGSWVPVTWIRLPATWPQEVHFVPDQPLTACHDYTAFVNGTFTDRAQWNLTNPTSWALHTICAPAISLSYPLGGEYLKGGSVENIIWSMTDEIDATLRSWVNYSRDGGADGFPYTVSSGVRSTGTIIYPWTLPLIDSSAVRIKVTVADSSGLYSVVESGDFTIDSTPPSIVSSSPAGWNVAVTSSVVVMFSEPVSNMTGAMKESFGLLDKSAGEWLAVDWTRLISLDWPNEIRFVPTSHLRMCADFEAHLNGTFYDRAHWMLTNPTVWMFHTVCAPRLTFPSSGIDGQDWSGGSVREIRWSMTDEIDTELQAWVNYSVDGGSDGYPYTVYMGIRGTGAVTLSWTLPLINTTAARLEIRVMDSSGLTTAATSDTFTIDSAPPSVLASAPSNGSKGVKITDQIQVVFDESVVRTSAEQAFSISPNPGDMTFSWTKTGMGRDILTVGHKPMKSKTDYSVTFSTMIKDDSDPGNHPTTALTIAFSTKPPPDVKPPVAKAVGHNQVQVGEKVTLDGSQSTGNITRYVWTITDNQGRIVEVLAGAVVTYVFRQNGRYAVTLKVTDELTGLSAQDTLEIVVTSNSNGLVLLSVSAAILLSSALIAGTEIGRVALLTLFAAPNHRRKTKGKPDPETRGMVRGYIIVHPGDSYSEIKHNLRLNDGALAWHLMKLEKEGLIRARTQGTRRRYYPKDVPLPLEDGGELHEIERRLLDSVNSGTGMSVKVLAEELGVSSQLALYHLRKLSQRRLLSLERRGLHLKAFPPPRRGA